MHLTVSRRYWSRCQLVVTTSACIQSMYIQSSLSPAALPLLLSPSIIQHVGTLQPFPFSREQSTRLSAGHYRNTTMSVINTTCGHLDCDGPALAIPRSSRIEISAIDLGPRVNREVRCLFHLSRKTRGTYGRPHERFSRLTIRTFFRLRKLSPCVLTHVISS